jgi:uncharacterized protein YukE
MAYRIKGNPDYISSRGQQLMELSNRIRSDLRLLDDTISPLRYTFLGNRARGFFEQYNLFAAQMYGLADVVKAFAEQLLDAAQRLREADRS